jgi:hypothetical protein
VPTTVTHPHSRWLRLLVAVAATVVLSFSGAAPTAAQGPFQGADDWAFPSVGLNDSAFVSGCQGGISSEAGGVGISSACDWQDACMGTFGMPESYCDNGLLHLALDVCGDSETCRRTAEMIYLEASALMPLGPYPDGQRGGAKSQPHRGARVLGDPHLRTFDDFSYTLMSAGEFSVMRDREGRDLVQGRFYPWTDGAESVLTGVATRLGEREVAVQLDPTTGDLQVFIDGVPDTEVLAGFEEGIVVTDPLAGAAQVVTVRGTNGLVIDVVVFDQWIDIGISAPGSMLDQFTGLLGDANGDGLDDLVDSQGRHYLESEIYDPAFVGTWRVKPEDSMFIPDKSGFDYHSDEALSYPTNLKTTDDVAGPAYEAARQTCSDAGLADDELEWCAYDVAATGEDSFGQTEPVSSRHATQVAHPETIVVQPPSGSSGSPKPSAGEETTPLELLADRLVPPNATEFSRDATDGVALEIVYTSTDSADSVTEYYRRELASAGFDVSTTGELLLFTTPDGIAAGILVRSSDDGSLINISLKRS